HGRENREEGTGQRKASPRADVGLCRRWCQEYEKQSQEQQPKIDTHLSHFFAVTCDFCNSFAFFAASISSIVLPGFNETPASPGKSGPYRSARKSVFPMIGPPGPRGGPPGPPPGGPPGPPGGGPPGGPPKGPPLPKFSRISLSCFFWSAVNN